MINIKEFQKLEDDIARGLKKAREEMIKFKKFKNTPIVVSKNGKIIEIHPNDISPQKP